MNAKKLLPKSLLDEKSWQIAVTVHKLQELQELQKNDMPVLGLAGAIDEKWKIGAGTQIGVPICITRSNGCLPW